MDAFRTDPTSGGPVAIVTGATWGAGREIARELARRGYAVVVVYLHDQRVADAAVDEILAMNGTAVAVRADLTDDLDVERLFVETKAAFGQIDVVAHAAIGVTSLVNQQAALQLRHGGAIVSVSAAEKIGPVVADQLQARGITVNGLTPGLQPPGDHHDAAELLAVLDRWRYTAEDRPGPDAPQHQ